ncbi:MAG TPA: hypothetical protein EYP98_04375 [Planctomycetes bacterium]|nr:hypothetical protein [Planctomycetota bacterium]
MKNSTWALSCNTSTRRRSTACSGNTSKASASRPPTTSSSRPLDSKSCTGLKRPKTLEPRVVYGYWPCYSEQNALVVLDPVDRKTEISRFNFPRQPGGRRMCLSDFFRKKDSGELDVVGFSLVTMGAVATLESERLFRENRYDEYLHFHGLSVEGAEALAEYWHKRMRQQLDIASEDAHDIRDLFKQKYQGSRYSFGYPACPNIEDQDKLLPLVEA